MIGYGLMWHSNIIARAANAGFNFQQYDANGDGLVGGNELQIVFISNEAEYSSGATRNFGCIRPAGASWQICMDIPHLLMARSRARTRPNPSKRT